LGAFDRCSFVPRFACAVAAGPRQSVFAVTLVTTTSTLVRFKDTINGRAYVINVSAVGQDRWRAEIANRPGVRAALMPFYGPTPDAAASLLSGWLTRASRPQ
jgi:hypothetical protein